MNSLQARERSQGTKSPYTFDQYSIRTTGIYATTFKLGLLQPHSIGPSCPAVFTCRVREGLIFLQWAELEREKILQLFFCKTQHIKVFTIHTNGEHLPAVAQS